MLFLIEISTINFKKKPVHALRFGIDWYASD